MKRIDSLAQRPILDANMSTNIIHYNYILRWWLAQKGTGSNRSRDAVR